MTTENNFTATAETFKENFTKGMKWMQDANAKLVETQKQQLKTVTEMFSKTSGTNLNNPFGDSGKEMTKMFQKNMETLNNFVKTAMKPTSDFTKLTDKDAIANEMKKQFDALTQQVSDITLLNQTNLDLLVKEFDTTKNAFTPIAEQVKTEMEKAIESSKETMQTVFGSYSTLANPSMEANKETIEKLNEQIKASVAANVKFWSDLMNTTSAETVKPTETKAENVTLKITSPASSKKQTTAHMN